MHPRFVICNSSSCQFITCVSSYICTVQTLDNTEGAIKNGQSRELGIGYTRRRKTKQNLEDTTMREPLAQALYLTRQHYRRTVPSGVDNKRITYGVSTFHPNWGRPGRECIVVGFSTTCAISTYHH